MYRKILVAVDGSHTSDIALQEAIKLAREARAQLRIVHAVDSVNLNPDVEFPNPIEMVELMVNSGWDILHKAEAAAREAGVKAEAKLIKIDALAHRVPEVIAQDAEAWPADLIVIGTHGRRGISRLFLGSVAEGVARVATKPVLLIRGD